MTISKGPPSVAADIVNIVSIPPDVDFTTADGRVFITELDTPDPATTDSAN